MTRFVCSGCGATLSADLVERPLPEFEVDDSGDEIPAPLMERGMYAVDPTPFGPPHVPITPELARLHGIDDATLGGWEANPPGRGPVHVSAGPAGTLVVNPDDTKGMRRHSDDRRVSGCCNVAGSYGPNLVCDSCGQEVATLKNDCWVGRTTLRFEPAGVRAIQHELTPSARRAKCPQAGHGGRPPERDVEAWHAIQRPETGRTIEGAPVKGYVVVLEGNDESGYSSYSPDLPGVIAAGRTQDDTERLMREAMAEHIALLRDRGAGKCGS